MSNDSIKTPKIVQPKGSAKYIWLLMVPLFALLAWLYQEELNWLYSLTSDRAALELKIKEQKNITAEREADNALLLQRIAELERVSQIDREAVKSMRERLKSYWEERSKMQEELELMRRVVSGKDSKMLQVKDLQLTQGGGPGRFNYQFTVAKLSQDNETIRGQLVIVVVGHEKKDEENLTDVSFSTHEVGRRKMSFRYFQAIKGELALPDGFEPSGVTIRVESENENYPVFSSDFTWVL